MEYHQLQAQQDFFIYIPDSDKGAPLGTQGAGREEGAAKSGPLHLADDDNWVEIPLTEQLVAYARVWGQRKLEDACC